MPTRIERMPRPRRRPGRHAHSADAREGVRSDGPEEATCPSARRGTQASTPPTPWTMQSASRAKFWAVLDEDETLMRPGDVLIQRGTYHAWSNRSDRVCRMLFILIDAEPLANH